ncbi:MAG: hypothetical protein QNJ09_05135 [Paracoccaceae bacterium]|nr:hypothetical protein [Paracoccaceae bacterium]
MAESKDARPTPPGLYDRDGTAGITVIEITAAIGSVLWLVLSAGYFLMGSGEGADGMRFLLVLMVVVMPIALIWVAVTTARSTRVLRGEITRLRAAIDAIRQAYIAQAQSGPAQNANRDLMKRLDALAAGQKNLETTLAMLGSTRVAETAAPVAPQPATADDQPALSLGTPVEALQPPLSNEDFIIALHFPETAEDQAGFAALRRALKDREASQLVQASQDILTLLSQDGIYMDDLRPDLARPEAWRSFAHGARGRAIAPLGGVRDRSSLALAAGRMKQDPIFRDAAHHFLRRFDKSFAAFETRASDAEITAFAGTRTARAFMLLGRVAGTFD